MKKMILVAALAAMMVFVQGCTNGCSTKDVGCAVEKTVVSTVAPLVSSQLQCSNPAAVQADISTWVGKIGICQKLENNQGGVIGSQVCTWVATAIVDQLTQSAIPAAWGCKATNVTGALNSVISMACAKIPFAPAPNH